MTQTTALSTRIAHLEALALPLPELRSAPDVSRLQKLIQAEPYPLQVWIAGSAVRWSINAHGRCQVRANRGVCAGCSSCPQRVEYFQHGERLRGSSRRQNCHYIQNLAAACHSGIILLTFRRVQ